MKRLLCLISGMNVGGAETFLMKIYRQLDRTKYQMDFCVNIKEPGAYDEEIKAMGGKIYYVPPKSENLHDFKKGLSKVVKENNYKYVLRITSNAAGFLDLKIAKKSGAEVCIARSSNSSDGSGFISKLVHYIGKIMYKNYVDVKIAPSDLAAQYTFGKKTYLKGKVNILHNAIDLNLFKYSEEARRQVRLELNIPKDALVIGHIGRFDSQKNHEFLIDVFQSILLKCEDAYLVLVGNGNLEQKIKTLVDKKGISENVIFAGIRSDIPRVLSAMDAFVFPSLYEGMPNTVIEAQATGLPCFISDTITREANIANLVTYLPLDNSNNWANIIINNIPIERKNVERYYKEQKYDIQSQTEEFVKLIFN